ncbi:hypothetical protein AB9P05_13165 [Roseivirga sp. BDSF3-8]|uniref:hypothetical protein n=1 Tax=Roseivirga sp. BDSF3-8 TaxID=3241598 RepID=UPI0035319353
MKNKEELNRDKVNDYLAKLEPGQQPRWGMMTPQHMVEHLEDVVNASSNKIPLEVVTPEDKLARYKEKGLLSPDNWPVNTRSPLLEQDKLRELRHSNLDEARTSLSKAMEEYDDYFVKNPGTQTNNAVFGALNYEEWQQFHFKHFRHHFQQFGLMERPHEEGMRS